VTAAHAAHEAHVRAALERLRLLGAGERQIAALKEAEQIDSNVTVPAPIDGIVLARMANLGLVREQGSRTLYGGGFIHGLVMASLNEKDFASVQVGSAAHITRPPTRTRLEWALPTSTRRWIRIPDGAGAHRSRQSSRKLAFPNVRRRRVHLTGRCWNGGT